MRALLIITLLTFVAFSAQSADESKFVLRSSRSAAFKNLPTGSEGLRIFWWNIGCSSTKGLSRLDKTQRAQFDPISQWENIENLISDEVLKPDVLILGEYCPSSFRQGTYDKLAEAYSNIYRLEKTNSLFKIRNGLRVFSKYGIKVLEEQVLKSGDFLQSRDMQACKVNQPNISLKYFNQNFWDRMLVELEVTKSGKAYKISPVHLANPWKFMRQCMGSIDVGLEILSGSSNPNYFQANELARHFSDEDSSVLIGDFNAPRVFYFGTASNSYARLRGVFGQSVVPGGKYTYFHQRGSFGPYSLDHAFVSENLNVVYGEVLPFAGSDHLPLYVIIN